MRVRSSSSSRSQDDESSKNEDDLNKLTLRRFPVLQFMILVIRILPVEVECVHHTNIRSSCIRMTGAYTICFPIDSVNVKQEEAAKGCWRPLMRSKTSKQIGPSLVNVLVAVRTPAKRFKPGAILKRLYMLTIGASHVHDSDVDSDVRVTFLDLQFSKV